MEEEYQRIHGVTIWIHTHNNPSDILLLYVQSMANEVYIIQHLSSSSVLCKNSYKSIHFMFTGIQPSVCVRECKFPPQFVRMEFTFKVSVIYNWIIT